MKHYNHVMLRSPRGGLIMPLLSEYDREMLFEHITDRVRRDRWVEVSVGPQRWRATLLALHERTRCTTCAHTLTIAHASAGSQLCTPCRKRALH